MEYLKCRGKRKHTDKEEEEVLVIAGEWGEIQTRQRTRRLVIAIKRVL